jgi:predicted GTPase
VVAPESIVHTERFFAPDAIGFRNATFTWTGSDPTKEQGVSQRLYRLQIEGELFFEHGHLNLIIGPTGCGKTSMLMALLGDLI